VPIVTGMDVSAPGGVRPVPGPRSAPGQGEAGGDDVPSRLSERMKDRVFDALPEAMLLTDVDRSIVDCNRAAEELFGRSRDEMIGLTPDQVGAGPARNVSVERVVEALTGTGAWQGDVTLPALPDRTISANIFPVLDDRGARLGYGGITRDVTAERVTTRQLAQAEQRWRTLLDVSPVGLALLSVDGRFDLVNRAMCRIVGYPPERLREMTFPEITHPDDRVGDHALAQQFLTGQIDHYALEKRYLHALGHTVWVHVSVSLIRDPDTGVPEYVAAVENITARKQAAERLTAIIESASDAFVGIAPSGYVTEWNTAAERLFGWTRAEAHGRPLHSLIIPPADRKAHLEGLARLGRGEPGPVLNRPIELTALTKSGREIPVELTVWHADGNGDGSDPHTAGASGEYYAFLRDSTERKRAAQKQKAIAAAQLAIADVELSPQKVMQEICRHAQALTGAEAASVEVPEGDEMVYRAGSGIAQTHRGLRLPVAGSLSGLALTTGQTLLCVDTLTDPRAHRTGSESTAARSAVVVPLRRGGQVHGVVKVYSTMPGAFDDDDCSTLDLLAAPFGAALANAWRLEATAVQALTDPLTGLGNRAHALQELHRALLRQGRRASGSTAVLFLDLDRFKPVNDTLGHDAGDQVLRSVADKLRLALRSSDTCARYGGDEFLVLCENVTSRNDVTVLAGRLIELVAGSYPLADRAVAAEIGVSIGIAVTSSLVAGADLLRAADEAMYEAKREGGNTFTARSL
jgi:diguanylate cyclase (GGDEF)-like protein/PAS domain S-box-containing protein